MSPLVQDVYLLLLSKLDYIHLNVLLKRVAQKPKGVTILSKNSPEILKKRVIETLQKSPNREGLLSFIIKGGLHDIISIEKIDYEKLNMSNYKEYLDILRKKNDIPPFQGILYVLENGGVERIESFFMESKENVAEFNKEINKIILAHTDVFDEENNEVESTVNSLKEELRIIEMKYKSLKKEFSKTEKRKKELETETNSLRQKNELEIKKILKIEATSKKKEIEDRNANHEYLISEKNKEITFFENNNIEKDKLINILKQENEKLLMDIEGITIENSRLNEKMNKKLILLLGDALNVDLTSFSDKYFDVISAANLNIETFSTAYETNRYDEVWLIDFQIPRKIKNELKIKYPSAQFKYIKDNSAFR